MCSRTGSRAQVKGKWFYLTNPSPVLQRCRSPIFTNQTISSWPALPPGRGKEGPFSISPSCLVIESVFNQVAWLQCNGFHLLPQWVGLSVSLSVAVSRVSEKGKRLKNTPLLPHLFVRSHFHQDASVPTCQDSPRHLVSVTVVSVTATYTTGLSQASEQQKESEGVEAIFTPTPSQAKKRVGRVFPSRLPAPERNLRAAWISSIQSSFRFLIQVFHLLVGNGTSILSNQVSGVIFPEIYVTQCR